MANATEARIYRQAALCGVLVVLAFVVPRLVPDREGGYASAMNAILVLLAMLAAAAAFAVYLSVRTFQAYGTISVPARVAGIAPGALLVVGLATLVLFLRF